MLRLRLVFPIGRRVAPYIVIRDQTTLLTTDNAHLEYVPLRFNVWWTKRAIQTLHEENISRGV